jgi:PAS domain-containing protein
MTKQDSTNKGHEGTAGPASSGQGIRNSEKQYRSLFENMLNGFAYCKMLYEGDKPVDFIYLDVNKSFETLTGLKNVTGKKVSEAIPGILESDPALIERYGRVSESGKHEAFETFVESLNDWYSISVYCPEKGYFIAVFDVITDQKIAEAELLASKNKLVAALESITDAVFISDLEGKFIDFNEAFATFHRFAGKAECAKTLAEYPMFMDVYFPNGELAPFEQWAVPRALRGEIVKNAIYLLYRRDTGESWVGSYSFAPILGNDGEIIGSVVVGRDITESHRAETAIREQLNELHRWYEVTLDRENRVLELKKEVNELLSRLGEPARYQTFLDDSPSI